MSDEVKNEAGEVKTAPKAKAKAVAKKVATKVAAKKGVAEKGAGKGKVAAKKAPSSRVASADKINAVLKFLNKQKGPVTRSQIVAGTGFADGINAACKALGDKVKREAAKFHDLGRGFVFTITAKGKAAAAKL